MGPTIVLAGSEVPTELQGLAALRRRAFARGSIPEFRFEARDPWPKIPIRRYGVIQFVRWGNASGRSRALPRAAWTRTEKVEAGDWSKYGGLPVEIAANFWCHNGAWVFVSEGIRGILVPDEAGWAVCYPICEKSSNYYKNMTRAEWMPLLINQRY